MDLIEKASKFRKKINELKLSMGCHLFFNGEDPEKQQEAIQKIKYHYGFYQHNGTNGLIDVSIMQDRIRIAYDVDNTDCKIEVFRDLNQVDNAVDFIVHQLKTKNKSKNQ